MRELNPRERNLGVVVLIVCGLAFWGFVSKQLKQRTRETSDRLHAAQAQLQQSQALFAAEAKPAAPAGNPADTKVTLTLLKELTLPEESENVHVVGVDHTGEGAFRVTLEGKFSEMMRYLGYLERKDSRFSVSSVDLSKARKDATATPASTPAAPGSQLRELTNKEPARTVRGVFQISMRG